MIGHYRGTIYMRFLQLPENSRPRQLRPRWRGFIHVPIALLAAFLVLVPEQVSAHDLHWRATFSSTSDTASRWTLGLNPVHGGVGANRPPIEFETSKAFVF
jgi:hypothetical protein